MKRNRQMNKRVIPRRQGERGMALILAIALLLILSVFGTTVLDVANRGISQTGRINPENEAFFTVDRAVEYSLSPTILDLMDELTPTFGFSTDDDPSGEHVLRILGPVSGRKVSRGDVQLRLVTPSALPYAFLNSPKGVTSLVAKRGGTAFQVHAEVDVPSGGQTITKKVDSVFIRMNYGTEEIDFGDEALRALAIEAAGG